MKFIVNSIPRRLSLVTSLFALLFGCQPPQHLKDVGALGPYSAAVRAGNIYYLSGKIGHSRETFEKEVGSAIDAIELDLDTLGLTLKDVVMVTAYLTDMDDYAAFNSVYAVRFQEPYPARACIAVAALPGGARVEIQAIARKR